MGKDKVSKIEHSIKCDVNDFTVVSYETFDVKDVNCKMPYISFNICKKSITINNSIKTMYIFYKRSKN